MGLLLAVGLHDDAEASRRSRAESQEAEQRLSDLGFWTGPIDGLLDSASRQALVAFQKMVCRARTGRLSAGDLEALRATPQPVPKEAGPAHIEVDIARQLLFVVDDQGVIDGIVSVSTGTGLPYFEKGQRGIAHTPRGRFLVDRKVSGWRVAPLGRMYFPSYFHKGFAIHGSPNVPARPASHGCIRVPMFAARRLFDAMPIGTPVLIYEGAAGASQT
jgi:hypothetical protein